MINPFSSGLVAMIPITVSWITHAPAATSPQASNMVTICRIGWLKWVFSSALGRSIRRFCPLFLLWRQHSIRRASAKQNPCHKPRTRAASQFRSGSAIPSSAR